MIIPILIFFAVVFTVSGICDLILLIKLFAVSPRKKFTSYVCVVLSGDSYIQQLNSIALKKRWYGAAYCDTIVAYTYRLDKQQIDFCKSHFSGYDILFIDEAFLDFSLC